MARHAAISGPAYSPQGSGAITKANRFPYFRMDKVGLVDCAQTDPQFVWDQRGYLFPAKSTIWLLMYHANRNHGGFCHFAFSYARKIFCFAKDWSTRYGPHWRIVLKFESDIASSEPKVNRHFLGLSVTAFYGFLAPAWFRQTLFLCSNDREPD